MSEQPSETTRRTAGESRPKRAALWMPQTAGRNAGGTAASVLAHALLLVLLFLPKATDMMMEKMDQGAGGPGPAGGGGGGNRGTGGVPFKPERLQFFVAAPAPVPVVVPDVLPPIEEKKPPEEIKPVEPQPQQVAQADTASKTTEAQSTVAGVGGGSGNDGSGGNGPGSGGGTGSGIGTGRGSGIGPGTGGGLGTVYPPSPVTLVVLPLPVPPRAKPYDMTACWSVDETGRGELLKFTPSKDAAYNRKVEESLRGYRFRPAVRLDGTPVRDTTCVRANAQ
jgi:protein TonB